jgi:hypothetical protein
MNLVNSVPETPIVELPPLVVDPVAPAEPIKPVPKPSPEGSSEFWTHVIRLSGKATPLAFSDTSKARPRAL